MNATTLQQKMKRDQIINQLKTFGVHTIKGQALSDVKYSTLLRTLAVKRATQQ